LIDADVSLNYFMISQTTINGIVEIGILIPNVDEAARHYAHLLGVDDWNIRFVDTDNGKSRNRRNGTNDVAVKAKIALAKIGGSFA